jgi:hypothetical protein
MNVPLDLLDRVQELAADLDATFPGARTKCSPFASGAIWLDVWMANRLFAFHYFPSEAWFAVDETTEEDAFSPTYAHGSADFDEAAEQLRALLRAAQTP